ISEEDTKLITWKQIKFIRGKSCKGKVVTWFSLIEKKYLTNSSNRKISKGLSTHNPNNMSIMPDKADIKEDNRIKNWVLVEEKKNSMTIRWVVKKRKREILVEHWQNKNVILKRGKLEQVLEKCGSCELNSNKGKEVCLSWIRKEDIQEVYPKIQNVANQKVLPIPKEVIAKKKTRNVEALASNFLDLQLTVEASLARHLVKFQVSNKALFLDLLEALEQNTLNRNEVYKFYTDGSLSSQGFMGASWVQISLEHNIV
ncbi:24705_t:CDS:1, partial [Gigaspora margarita]